MDLLRRVDEIAISVISIGELLAGFKSGSREKKNRAELWAFLDAPKVNPLPLDVETTEFYAEILQNPGTLGRPIPTNNLWISAVAMRHGLRLYSKDKHFKAVPGLICIG